jgi:Glycosyltransferases involved in cell wall biogenesis
MIEDAKRSRPEAVSVVVPWHQNRELLRRAIGSLRNQTVPPHEIIVVCNGLGYDQGPDIEREFHDLGVTTVAVDFPDANKARNAGIDAATGTSIAFLDADDEFVENRVEMVSELLSSDSSLAALCGAGFRIRGEGQHWLFAKEARRSADSIGEHILVRGNLLLTSSFTVRTNIARLVRFTDGLPKFQDLDFLVRAEAFGAKIEVVTEPMFIYHDEISDGRLSRGSGYDKYVQWALSHEQMTDKVKAAFIARAIAQHEFPSRPLLNGRRLFEGWRVGGIAASTTLAMAVRGLIPTAFRDRAFAIYSKVRGRAA